MKNSTKFKFLGSADSVGIPVHNCSCDICKEYRKEKKENLASCAYIEIDNEIILIDAGHDNLASVFNHKIIAGIFLTHFHADHCLGLLRLRHSSSRIDCFHPKDKEGFADLFKHKHSINYIENNVFETIIVKGISFTPIPLLHSKNTTGYLIEYNSMCIAYLSDCAGINTKSMDFLKSKVLDYVFIDACYDERKNKGNHLNYEQAETILDELKAKKSFLIHASHKSLNYILKEKIILKYPYIEGNFEINLITLNKNSRNSEKCRNS